MSYRESVERYRALTARTLEEYMGNPYIPKGLLDAMSYSLYNGGKRLRPCLTLAVCEMMGGDVEDALPVACALEMIHTYSLIHDDLPAMDDDDFRRGKPSNHKVFGEGMAVLAGDGLLSYAFEVMLSALALHGDNPGYLEAIRSVAGGAGVCGMVAGQAVDLESEGDETAGATLPSPPLWRPAPSSRLRPWRAHILPTRTPGSFTPSASLALYMVSCSRSRTIYWMWRGISWLWARPLARTKKPIS